MSDEEIKILVEGWLHEVGQRPENYGYAHVYSEGWRTGVISVMGELDKWLRSRRK